MKKLDKKIRLLGINYDSHIFVIFRLILSILLFLYLLLSLRLGYIVAPLMTLIFYSLSEYILIDLPIKRRSVSLERDALDYIPALLLNLKNGKSVKTSIKNSSKVVKNELSNEFSKVINNLKIGFSLEEGLEDLSERIPNLYIQNMILDLKENNRDGDKIVDSLEWQLNSLKDNYNQEIISIKKMMPIKLCLLCIVFLAVMIFLIYYIAS